MEIDEPYIKMAYLFEVNLKCNVCFLPISNTYSIKTTNKLLNFQLMKLIEAPARGV